MRKLIDTVTVSRDPERKGVEVEICVRLNHLLGPKDPQVVGGVVDSRRLC